MFHIAVVDETGGLLTQAQIEDFVAAMNKAIGNDFCNVWGTYAIVRFSPSGTLEPNEWRLHLAKNSDQVGALGYHELTPDGQPELFAFIETDLQDGSSWTVTASHEVFEALVDPWCILTAAPGDGKVYALEVCDAVEADDLGFEITAPSGNKVLISDFVLPAWFLDGVTVAGSKFDFQGKCTAAVQLLPDGYISEMDSSDNWNQITAQLRTPRAERKAIPVPGNRRWKRTLGVKNWRKSDK